MLVLRKMATLSSFRWWFIILQILCCNTQTPTVNSTNDSEENSYVWYKIENFLTKDSVMYFSAGFMTASLIFSIGCFVSKCKTSQRRDDDAENAELDNEDQVFTSAPGNEYVNEGSCESDQKSYAYCHIDTDQKSSDDFSQSSTSKTRLRDSYDLVDYNRKKSSLLNDKENPNPYNHVTVDMEVTEYDNASFLKPRIEAMDPTYSHLSEVKLENENPSLTTKKDDKGKIEHRSMDETNNSSNKENKKQKTSEKEKQKKPENKKEKKPEKQKLKQKKLEIETQKQKKPESEKQKNPEKDKVKQKNQQKKIKKPKIQEKEALKQKKPEPKEKIENKQEQINDKLQTAMETENIKSLTIVKMLKQMKRQMKMTTKMKIQQRTIN